MTKFVDKISEKVLVYMAIVMAFMLGGSSFSCYETALVYGVEYKQEFAFLPEWTVSPIALLVYGIVCCTLGSVLIYLVCTDQKKEEP